MNRPVFFCFMLILLVVGCEDKVNEFGGFTQKELEFLLSSGEGKGWQRIAMEEDGVEMPLENCDLDNYLIYLPGNLGAEKPLLYAYNPSICDSLEFCNLHPDFCQADTMLCNADPDFCDVLSDDILYIGSWYAKAPFINNDRSDTLIFSINNKKEAIFVVNITSQYAAFQYKKRTGNNGGLITEYYNFSPQ